MEEMLERHYLFEFELLQHFLQLRKLSQGHKTSFRRPHAAPGRNGSSSYVLASVRKSAPTLVTLASCTLRSQHLLTTHDLIVPEVRSTRCHKGNAQGQCLCVLLPQLREF